MLDRISLISMSGPVIDKENLLKSPVEDVVFDGDVGPVEDGGQLLG